MIQVQIHCPKVNSSVSQNYYSSGLHPLLKDLTFKIRNPSFPLDSFPLLHFLYPSICQLCCSFPSKISSICTLQPLPLHVPWLEERGTDVHLLLAMCQASHLILTTILETLPSVLSGLDKWNRTGASTASAIFLPLPSSPYSAVRSVFLKVWFWASLGVQ